MRRFVLVVVLAAFSLGAAAQEAPSLRLMTVFVFEGTEPAVREAWAASLDAALAALPRVSSVKRAPSDGDPIAAAASEGFDAVVSVDASRGEDGLVAIRTLVAEAQSGRERYRSERAEREPTESELGRTFWLPLASLFDSLDFSPPAATFIAEFSERPKLSARPGLYAEPGLYMGQFGDFWFGYSLAPRLSLKVGLYQFLVGYVLDDRADSAIVSMDLLQPGVGADLILFPSFAGLRVYAAFSAFFRLSGERFTPDPIASLGSTFMLGIERAMTDRIALFFEAGAAYYPFCDGILMAVSAGVSEDNRRREMFYGKSWYLEMPQFRFGARLGL